MVQDLCCVCLLKGGKKDEAKPESACKTAEKKPAKK